MAFRSLSTSEVLSTKTMQFDGSLKLPDLSTLAHASSQSDELASPHLPAA